MIAILIFGPLLLCTSCVTKSSPAWSPTLLRAQIVALKESCRLKDNSGFSADLIFKDEGSARIEAAWDSKGQLNGQVINPLGEDLLNFRIDSSGLLQTDIALRENLLLGSALEFLAELGTLKTRLLLCSGLFLADSEQLSLAYERNMSEIDFSMSTYFSKWNVLSRILPIGFESNPKSQDVRVETEVSVSELFFKKRIANIEWTGKRQERFVVPQTLTVQSSRSSLKLSFLDFE